MKEEKLLEQYFDVIKQFKKIGVLTSGNLIGDYGEYYVAKKYKNYQIKLETNSSKSIDGTDKNGKTYQIKTRRIVDEKKSIQFGILRNLDEKNFDYLVCIIFVGDDVKPRLVAKLTDSQLRKEPGLRYNEYEKGHKLTSKIERLKKYVWN